MNLEDTIVAACSPPGRGSRGIVRVSGAQAIAIGDALFRAETGRRLTDVSANCRLGGVVRLGRFEVPASMYLFRRPRSYTREDVIEFHLLGAPALLGWLVECCLAAGARLAEPGEFTARAYLAGALDWSQVHAIAGLIAARSDQQLRAAERLLHGALGDTARAARADLDELIALVEAALDFADEPIDFIAPDEVRRRLAGVKRRLEAAVEAGWRADRWAELPRVVLTGRPNVGKSSLFNRLIGAERAIASPWPGTTRDVLSATVDWAGREGLLLDIAGEAEPQTELDSLAQQSARQAAEQADLVLEVRDIVESAARPAVVAAVPRLVVLNKADLLSGEAVMRLAGQVREREGVPVVAVSAVDGTGCDALRAEVARRLSEREAAAPEGAVALMAEHGTALRQALAALEAALDVAGESGGPLPAAELVAAELRAAARALGVLVGEQQTEEMLERIFSRFCIGK